MALGREDLKFLSTTCEELVSNQKEIVDCKKSFVWVLDRLGDWASDTDVGAVVRDRCTRNANALEKTIAETDKMIAELQAFIEKQTTINASQQV